jgi:hypothetical protein
VLSIALSDQLVEIGVGLVLQQALDLGRDRHRLGETRVALLQTLTRTFTDSRLALELGIADELPGHWHLGALVWTKMAYFLRSEVGFKFPAIFYPTRTRP